MSVDREYKIRISTSTEGDAGAAAHGLKDTGKAAEKAGEDLKFMDLKGREAHEAFNKLNQLAPGLGTSLRAAFNPELIGVSAFLIGIEAIKSGIEAYNKKLEDAAAAGEKADFAAGFDAVRDVIRDAVDSADEYLRKLHQILEGEQGVTAELTNRLQVIAAIKAATQEQAEAEKTLALAKIQQDEALGRITQTQAIEAKAAVEKQFLDRKAQEDEATFTEQQKARTDALNEAAAKQGGLDKAVADQQKKIDEAKTAQGRAKDAPKIEDVQKAQQAADEAMAKFQKEAAFALMPDVGIHSQLPERANLAVRRTQEEARRLQDEADQKQKLFTQAAHANAVDVTAMENELKARQAAAQKNAEAIAKSRDDVNNAASAHDAPGAVSARAGALSASESAIAVQARTELLRRFQELQREYERQGAGGMSINDIREMIQIVSTIHEIAVQQGQNKVTKAQFKQEMDALKRRIESLGK